jgi:hypothetical protein
VPAPTAHEATGPAQLGPTEPWRGLQARALDACGGDSTDGESCSEAAQARWPEQQGGVRDPPGKSVGMGGGGRRGGVPR